jgi:alpha-beta hydrolase superfamily lysophospholipase
MDGNRKKTTHRVPIPGDESEFLVYYEWDPVPNAPDRGNRVVFLFAGFLAQQVMMFPLMREFTRQGYHVITGDFRGHGESGGKFTMDWNVLREDFLAIYNDVKEKREKDGWNMTHVAVCGHSMGGFASINFGFHFDFVWTVVGLAPAPYRDHVNATNPKNLMIIVGSQDQAFTTEVTLSLFHQAVPNGEPGKLYGDPLQGTAKKLVIARWARHENELIDDYCLSQAVTFVEMSFGYMKPGDDFVANQALRMSIMQTGTIMGMLGICLLFIVLNQIKFKRPEIEFLGKLFDSIVGDNLTPVDYDAMYLPKKSKKENAIALFLGDWFLGYGPSILLGFIIFALSGLFIQDIFSNLQIIIVGVPGICNVFVAWRNYRRENQQERRFKTFGDYLKPIRHQVTREFTGKSIIIGIFMYALSMFIVLYGFGQSYMFVFPMNRRIYNLILLIPFMAVMYLAQSWGLVYHLVERLRNEHNGYWKAIGVTLLTKHFGILVASLAMLLMGNTFISIFLLLTVVDLLATILLITNWWFNKNYGSIVVWVALTVSTVYLGYAGIINPYEILLSDYNALYWIG